MPNTGRLVFMGNAVGAAALITRFKNRQINGTLPAQPTCALPSIGGASEQSLKGFTEHRFAHFLSFQSARTTAKATQAAGAMVMAAGGTNTIASPRESAVIVGANVKRSQVAARLEVRELNAQLRCVLGESGAAICTCEGTFLSGLKIDGYPIDVQLLMDFSGARTSEPASAPFVYSIVSGIITRHPDAVVRPDRPHVLQISGFGSIALGEVVSSEDKRKLTLMRVELDSRDAGVAELCAVEAGVIAGPEFRTLELPARTRGGINVLEHIEDGLSGMP